MAKGPCKTIPIGFQINLFSKLVVCTDSKMFCILTFIAYIGVFPYTPLFATGKIIYVYIYININIRSNDSCRMYNMFYKIITNIDLVCTLINRLVTELNIACNSNRIIRVIFNKQKPFNTEFIQLNLWIQTLKTVYFFIYANEAGLYRNNINFQNFLAIEKILYFFRHRNSVLTFWYNLK